MHMDVIRSLTRDSAIGYHLAEGEAWLSASERGTHTTLLSYSAFEFRLEIERVAVELFVRIRGTLDAADIKTLRDFGRIENRIYELEGNQRILNAKIEFFNIVLEALQVDWRVGAINLGELRKGWQYCSELCHISWTFHAASEMAAEEIEHAFVTLSGIQELLRSIVTRGIAWPHINDSSFGELQSRFLEGLAKETDVKEWFAERGIWAQVVQPDGSKEFSGTPIPRRAG
jgi:hypothetical protein